jgi:hypothetical protein
MIKKISHMIRVRFAKDVFEPTLVGFEATLATSDGVYDFVSREPIVDSASPFHGGLFGSVAWPQSCFQIQNGLTIEQQMFVSHDTSDIAISWELGRQATLARLVVQPYFTGCGPRSYRDAGFRRETEENGGRLYWVPSVCGPKIIADTNGHYVDEPIRSAREIVRSISKSQSLAAPGRFEFELSRHPSILIFSSEGRLQPQNQQFIGTFLANLMQPEPERLELEAAQHLIAA